MIHETINLKDYFKTLENDAYLTSFCQDNFNEWSLNEKRKCLLTGIISLIVLIIDFLTIIGLGSILIVEKATTFWLFLILAIIVMVIALIVFFDAYFDYKKYMQNKKKWDGIIDKYSLNERIHVSYFVLDLHMRCTSDNLLSNLFINWLPIDGVDIVITQSEDAENIVEVIYILENDKTVTEKFICFNNEKVQCLRNILNLW